MWDVLWDDFEARSQRLAGGGKIADAIDQTIAWQIRGVKPFVVPAIPAPHLHLPELFSGAPWAFGDVPELRGKWIAFVTVNPTIDPSEIFPTRSDLTTIPWADLESYFKERFEPGPLRAPLHHGRDGHQLAVWNNRARPVACYQRTWGAIDNELRNCFAVAGIQSVAPLGRVAAIVDVVPWKFARWSDVPRAVRDQLLHLGQPYLDWTLSTYRPAAVVAAGTAVRQVLHQHYSGVPAYVAAQPQAGHITIGGQATRFFGVAAPTSFGNAFGAHLQQIGPQLRTAVGLPP